MNRWEGGDLILDTCLGTAPRHLPQAGVWLEFEMGSKALTHFYCHRERNAVERGDFPN